MNYITEMINTDSITNLKLEFLLIMRILLFFSDKCRKESLTQTGKELIPLTQTFLLG